VKPIRNYAGAPPWPKHLGTWVYGATAPVPVDIPRKPTLEQIKRCEQAIAERLEPVEIEPVHYFADGLYGREITIPAGTVLTGKIHRGEHLNFLMKGDITVWTEDGMKRLQAPAVIVSKPGTKRVGFAHTDTVWVTVHASEETDLAALEATLIEPEAAITTDGDKVCLGSQ
jgi:quercetin dioxygenase-like cupin family protein